MTSASQVLEQSIVVFSMNDLPISGVNVKRAIALLVTGKAEALDLGNEVEFFVRRRFAACRQTSPNLVICTPLEAGMPLHTKPKAPIHSIAFTERFWRSEHLPPGIGGIPRSC